MESNWESRKVITTMPNYFLPMVPAQENSPKKKKIVLIISQPFGKKKIFSNKNVPKEISGLLCSPPHFSWGGRLGLLTGKTGSRTRHVCSVPGKASAVACSKDAHFTCFSAMWQTANEMQIFQLSLFWGTTLAQSDSWCCFAEASS